MKRLLSGACAMLGLALSNGVRAEASCDFNIVGTWETARSETAQSTSTARYRFNANGTVTTLRRASLLEPARWQEPAGSEFFLYRLDDPKTPTLIELIGNDGKTTRGTLTITQFDRDTFTTSEGTLDENSAATRWLRADPRKHFILFATRAGHDVHAGGPAFVMLVETEAGHLQSDAFGLYLAEGEPVVGRIPQKLRRQFMAESRLNAGTTLRVELSAAEFERSARVMRTWRKRADGQTLLYDSAQLNNIVFLQQIAESVNRCGEVMQLYNLTWKVDDKIAVDMDLARIGLRYIEQLKQLNRTRHVTDEDFLNRTGIRCGGACT